MGTMDPRASARGPRKETKARYEYVAHLFLRIVFLDGLQRRGRRTSRWVDVRSHQCVSGLHCCRLAELSRPDGCGESLLVASKPRRATHFDQTWADAAQYVTTGKVKSIVARGVLPLGIGRDLCALRRRRIKPSLECNSRLGLCPERTS